MKIRAWAAIMISVLLACVDLAVTAPAQACACGGFVASDGEHVAANSEYAALSWDGATERMILSIDTQTVAHDAALLIPTPSPAKVALDEPDVFTQLRKATAPRVEIRHEWWPDWGIRAGSGASQSAPGSHVTVFRTSKLGPLEVSVLAADDAHQLSTWLTAHHYVISSAMTKALTPYIKEGWYYTAIRLTADDASLSGALQPLDLTFASSTFVYPMRMSVAAPESQFVRTYVFADHEVERTDETARRGTSVYFAGRLPDDSLTAKSLVDIRAKHPYLTVIDQYFSSPRTEIVSDFSYGRAARDRPYRRVEQRTEMVLILGVPAGLMLIFIGLAGVAAVGTIGVVVRRRRARRARSRQ